MRRYLYLFLLITINLAAQTISVSPGNKTIAVSADATAVADPDIATLHIGFHDYAETQKDAYSQNLIASEAILKAIKSQGVSDKQIESEEFQISSVEPVRDWTEEQKNKRLFEAKQSWKVKVSARSAQKVLDAAIRAGANESSQPEWDLKDRAGLQAKAGELALIKAKRIAEQMAAGLGVKLGNLIYASNRASSELPLNGRNYVALEVEAAPPPPPPVLRLFSAEVKQDATVYAVFQIE